LEHVACPSSALNVPGAHGVSCTAPTEQYEPAPHVMQSATLVITTRDVF
jgi:hypothetical protein